VEPCVADPDSNRGRRPIGGRDPNLGFEKFSLPNVPKDQPKQQRGGLLIKLVSDKVGPHHGVRQRRPYCNLEHYHEGN
jgi:hypothetical protein